MDRPGAEDKAIIDDYEKEEFDQRICYAMEYNQWVRIMISSDGFKSDVTGRIHYIDTLSHQLSIE